MFTTTHQRSPTVGAKRPRCPSYHQKTTQLFLHSPTFLAPFCFPSLRSIILPPVSEQFLPPCIWAPFEKFTSYYLQRTTTNSGDHRLSSTISSLPCFSCPTSSLPSSTPINHQGSAHPYPPFDSPLLTSPATDDWWETTPPPSRSRWKPPGPPPNPHASADPSTKFSLHVGLEHKATHNEWLPLYPPPPSSWWPPKLLKSLSGMSSFPSTKSISIFSYTSSLLFSVLLCFFITTIAMVVSWVLRVGFPSSSVKTLESPLSPSLPMTLPPSDPTSSTLPSSTFPSSASTTSL